MISGSGSVSQVGAGMVMLTASNTYSGATVISGGTLQVGNGGSGASIGATSGVGMANNARCHTTRRTTAPSPRRSAAAAALTKVGSGTLTLTAANTYTGATVVQTGTLKLGGSFGVACGGRHARVLARRRECRHAYDHRQ